MNKKEIVQKVIINNGGIAKIADFMAEGIKNYEVAALCKEGFIERIRRGFYQLPHSSQITEEQLKKIEELLQIFQTVIAYRNFYYTTTFES